MPDQSRKRLQRATIVFWILLVFIAALLVWWLISLEQQNKTIHALKREGIIHQKGSDDYLLQWNYINQLQRRNSVKHITEGISFLLVILFGAVYIYRLVRRQFQLQQQQQNFIMAVTHELKTPVSVARLNLETLQRHNLDAQKKEKLMQVSLQETLRLDTLINNILIASQLDGDAYKASKEELSFSDLVLDGLTSFGNRYPDRALKKGIEDGIELGGDTLLLKLLLSNLLENANKYSHKFSPITCTLQQASGQIILQVTDEGTGITDDEKKKIFSKFYRIGDEQTRKTKGTGLGLYICRKIADHHNAAITVKDNEPGGSNFVVTFFAG